MTVSDKLEGMWEKPIVAWGNVVTRHLTGGAEEHHENCQDFRCSSRDPNQAPQKDESRTSSRMDCFAMKMGTLCSSKIFVTIYQSTLRHIPE